MANKFEVSGMWYFDQGRHVRAFKICRYEGSGTAFVTEGLRETGETIRGQKVALPWETREEAEVAAARANAGDTDGIQLGSYADD